MSKDRLVKLAEGLYTRSYPSGKRAFQVQFFYRGARCRETLDGLDPGKKAHVRMAENRLGSIRDQIARASFNYAEFFPESKRARFFGFGGVRTVREVGDSWLADMKLSLPHSTYRSYNGPMQRFVYPAIGKLRVRDVTPEHIRDAFRGADITLKTARNYSIPLKGIFQRALDDGDVTSNPMHRVTLKRLIPANKHRSDYEVDPLSEAEISTFLEACRKHRPTWSDYWTVAFYTGVRTSEQYGMEWPDWDGASALRIERAVVERQVKTPKTASSVRTLQLTPMVTDALKHQRSHGGTAFGARIFWHPEHEEVLVDYEKSQAVFDFVCKKAGLRRRNQYQTRHTYASNMLMQAENPLFVARQMGHKDIYMLLRIYAKWIKDAATYVPRGDYGNRRIAE
ncbi:MAG: DUF3596 domain-containing protein [Gammaproteobacteria bacterium]